MMAMTWKKTQLLLSPLLLLLLLVKMSLTSNASAPVVDATWGRVQGVVISGLENRTLHGFLGIPYAVPPVGDLRFEQPRPHPGPGQGRTFVADKVAPACIQDKGLVWNEQQFNEDCLILDVYVPLLNTSTLRPVMFFIHGGGFSRGDSSTYKPSRLVVDEDVVVVVIQYRLGFFGFLSTSDRALTSNLGLWDQHLALTWVRDNIAAFGGDPSTVTIFGESAGSMSVGIHTLSPHSKGLFKRAILQSGSPSNTIMVDISSQMSPELFANFSQTLGCAGSSLQQRLACIKGLPAEGLQAKAAEFQRKFPMEIFSLPVVDGDFIPASASEILRNEGLLSNSSLKDVETIIGFNDQEGALMFLDKLFANLLIETKTTKHNFDQNVYNCLGMSGLIPVPILAKTISFTYLGEDYADDIVDVQDTTDLYGDCLLTVPIVDWALQLAANPRTAPRYVYVLEHQFTFNEYGPLPGSHHGDDLFLLFDMEHKGLSNDSVLALFNKTGLAQDEMPLSAMFVKLFATFARSGTPQLISPGAGAWPRFTNDTQQVLSITNSTKVLNNVGRYKERWAFWNRFLPDLAKLITDEGQGEKVTEGQCVNVTVTNSSSAAVRLVSCQLLLLVCAQALAHGSSYFLFLKRL